MFFFTVYCIIQEVHIEYERNVSSGLFLGHVIHKLLKVHGTISWCLAVMLQIEQKTARPAEGPERPDLELVSGLPVLGSSRNMLESEEADLYMSPDKDLAPLGFSDDSKNSFHIIPSAFKHPLTQGDYIISHCVLSLITLRELPSVTACNYSNTRGTHHTEFYRKCTSTVWLSVWQMRHTNIYAHSHSLQGSI